jgi:diguanylate cyclase (GGDEF)-like protein
VAADRDRMAGVRSQLLTEGRPYEQMYVIERYDGVVRTVYEQAQVVCDARGKPVHVEGVTQDITDRVEAERRIRQLSMHDALTGLPNREFFQKLVASGLEQGRNTARNCAVLQLDVDRFKAINDALGVAAGDMVLRTLAERLQAISRTDKTVQVASRGDVLARVGPNSLGLFLAGVSSAEEVAAVATRMLARIAEPLQVGTHELRLTASAGIAMSPRDARDSQTLLRYAEQALYAAKRAARGGFLFFDESINADARSLLARETELRRALHSDELRVFLQPKVNAGGRVVIGAEALVRWEHPERGLLLPAEFLPIAETTGLIEPISEWVQEQTCRLLLGWKHAGLPLVPVSVNVSTSWFMSERLTAGLEPLLARHQLAPQLLVLEITESVLMQDMELCLQRMRSLRERGFGLSLDDFGTGFSSLSYLKHMPLDELKLDRSFVTDVDKGHRDRALAAAVITLGNMLDMRVVAEGVETETQAAELVAMGCRLHQGYLYGRPMPAATFALELERGAARASHGLTPRSA